MPSLKRRRPHGLPQYLSADEVSWLLDCSRQRVDQYAEAGIVLKASRGRYQTESIPAAVRWLRAAREAGPATLNELKAALMREKLALTTMQRRKLEGSVVDAEMMVQAAASVAAAVRTRIMATPSKLAAQLVGLKHAANAEQILAKELTEALEQLSNFTGAPEKLAQQARIGPNGNGSAHHEDDDEDEP